jgi:hypothetical protein
MALEEVFIQSKESVEKLIADSNFSEKDIESIKQLMNFGYMAATYEWIAKIDYNDDDVEEYYNEYTRIRDLLK